MGSPGLLEKQQRRQRRQQQSYVNTTESKVHLHKKEISKEDRFWTFIPGCQKCKRDSFETRISKCVTNIRRHHDQDEREADGAMHWNAIPPVLKGRFQNQLEKEFTDEDWLHCLYLERFKARFEIFKDDNEN